MNSWCRDPYCAKLAEGFTNGKGFPDAVDDAIEVFAKEVERFIKLIGSEGKA